MSSSEQTASPMITTFEFAQLEKPAHLGMSSADVLTAAWAEIEHLREEARAAGEEEGRAAGIAAVAEEAKPAIASLGTAIAAIEGERDRFLAAIESQAAELALRIAEQIVAGALDVRPELIVDITRVALRRLADRQHVTVLVNPTDVELLTGAAERLAAELGGIEHIEVHADRRILRGGAIVRTELGEIDTTVTSQLEEAREIVRVALRGEEPSLEANPDDA